MFWMRNKKNIHTLLFLEVSSVWCLYTILTYFVLDTGKQVLSKKWRPKWNAAWGGIFSRSALFVKIKKTPPLTGLTLKNCWFAVLIPTHPKQTYPKLFIALLRIFPPSNSVNKYFFKIIKSCILIQEMGTDTVVICILTLYITVVEL